MTSALADQIATNATRCTEATLTALGVFGECPKHGTGVIEALTKAGKKVSLETMNTRETLKTWVKRAPKQGSYYVVTSGHAMAFVNGVLVDTMFKGPDRRIVCCSWMVM